MKPNVVAREATIVSESTKLIWSHDRRSCRCRYLKHGRCSMMAVIVDIDAEGREDWTEQAPDEYRWYPFTPSLAERELLARVARHAPVSQPLALSGGSE